MLQPQRHLGQSLAPTPPATGPAVAAGAGLQDTPLLVAPNPHPPRLWGLCPASPNHPATGATGGGGRRGHSLPPHRPTAALISVTIRPVSATCIYTHSRTHTHTETHTPPLINNSRSAGPRPPEPPIGYLAGPAGCLAIPLAAAAVHQRGHSHCLQSVAFCSAPTWRGRIRTGTETGTSPLPGRPHQFGLSLLTPATCLPSPGS